jgi:CheY-like chemotaxis protein/signal transduction histidine kinase
MIAIASPIGALIANQNIPNGLFPTPFLLSAVMITAHFSGMRAGILGFVLSFALLDYFYIPPFGTLAIDADAVAALVQFIVPAALGMWFIHKRKEVELLLARETAMAKRLQGEQSPADLGRTVLEYLAPELGAPVASFYEIDDAGTAHRRAGYAFDPQDAPETIARGAGVIGQAVRENRVQVVATPPDYLTVRSSLGHRRPTSIIVVPAHDGERAHAVVELGLFRRLDRGGARLLARIAEPIAVAVRTASYRDRLQKLLDETRRQAEAIKAQDEELRAANEELEERGQAMLESQQKLEEQQVELEQTNATLQNQASLLEQHNEDLARAQDAVKIKSETAERANRTKSEFLANMSHELRTPLNSALILARLLTENREGNLTPEQIRYAETIHAAGNDLLAMIDDVLDLAKIEAGMVDLRIEDVAVARVREDLSRTFEPIAAQRGLRFEVTVADTVPSTLRTDALRLAQILKNLLSNAFKFTEHGVVSLAIASDGDAYRFVVSDTGIGIAADQLEVIFEAFRQADGTTNRKHGGTGLGLSISRDLARMLGGEIRVDSSPGGGSTFTLSVPSAARAAVRATSHVPAAARAVPIRAPHPGSARTILVIEDDPRFADIVAELAREMQFEAVVAATVDDALRIAAERPPDGIVLDMQLPDGSGLDLLERLKHDSRTRHIPVHVISIANHTRAARDLGAIGYMIKPVEREQIRVALHRLEALFTRSMRRLLVVEPDLAERETIHDLLGGDQVEIVTVGTARDALAALGAGAFDCVVTDLSLPDASGYELLETMAGDEARAFPSVVVYTGASLTAEDEDRLRRYSSSIIVKGARAPERLLDEVTLFLHQLESALPPERQRMLKRARDREAIFEDRNILIVEDDVRNVFALTSALEPKGMKLTIARNGREALAALDRDPSIDLVLMDIMMPEMDGIEATRAVRRDTRWADLPIIALTAKAMKDDHDRCLEAGANDYMSKPLDVERLLSLLRVWLSKTGGRAA